MKTGIPVGCHHRPQPRGPAFSRPIFGDEELTVVLTVSVQGTRKCVCIFRNLPSPTGARLGDLRPAPADQAGCGVVLLCSTDDEDEDPDLILRAAHRLARVPA